MLSISLNEIHWILIKQHSIPEFCLELHRGFIPQRRVWSFPHVDFIQKMTDMAMGIMEVLVFM